MNEHDKQVLVALITGVALVLLFAIRSCADVTTMADIARECVAAGGSWTDEVVQDGPNIPAKCVAKPGGL